MVAVRGEIELTRGATFAHVFTWTDKAGTAINVTGYTARFTIDNRAGAEVVSVTSAGGSITLGGAAGTVAVTLTAAETAALARESVHGGRYAVVLTASGGSIVPLADGRVAVLEVPGL